MTALRRVAAAVVMLAVLAVPGCERPSDDPEDLGVIAAWIHAEPERESEILEQHGMTPEEFRDRIWEISEDPDKARRYMEAMERELESRGTATQR
jgi:hypothetical protein